MSYLEAPKETEMVMAGVAEDATATNVGSVTYVESRGGFLEGLRSLFNSSPSGAIPPGFRPINVARYGPSNMQSRCGT